MRKTFLASWLALLALVFAIPFYEALADFPSDPVQAPIFHTYTAVDTDLLDEDFTPPSPGAIRVSVSTNLDAVLNLQLTDGTDTVEVDFNSGSVIEDGNGYTFTWGVHPDVAINFQLETACTVEFLLVEFLRDGVM